MLAYNLSSAAVSFLIHTAIAFLFCNAPQCHLHNAQMVCLDDISSSIHQILHAEICLPATDLLLLVHNWYFFSFCSFFASFKGIDSEIKKANDRVDSLLKAFNLKLIFVDYSVPITNLKLSLVTLHSRVPSQNFKVIPLKNYIDSLTLITQPL